MESPPLRFFASPWMARGAVMILILVHFTLGVTSAWIKSPTVDEYTYIATGYLYVTTGDFRLDRTHPPLIRLLIGWPLRFIPITLPPLQMEKWDTPDSYFLGYRLGWEMLLGGANDWRKILFLARLPILLLSCGLAGLVYLWGKKLYGTAGGLTSLFLYAFCPNLLAHGRLATMDLGSCFFMCLALFMLYRYTERQTTLRFLLAGMALGGALAAKVTALLLIPVYVMALVWMQASATGSLRRIPLVPFAKNTFAMGLIAWLTLLAVYGYPFKPFYYLDTLQNVLGKSFTSGRGGEAVPGMPHRNYAFYLFGRYSTEGWPYYYLAAAAVKTPLPVLLGLLLCLSYGSRRWRGLPDGLLVGTMVLLHAAAAFNRVNIGLRHVLPFYPMLYLYLGRLGELSGSRIGRRTLVLLAAWYILGNLWIYPDYLAYFNEAVGGPRQGHRYLDDSNLDWGQDFARLAAIQDAYPNEPLIIASEWYIQPGVFGLRARRMREEEIATPPSGIVAVSKHYAVRHRIFPRSPSYFNWLEQYEPVAEVGHSIWIFRFGPSSSHQNSM